MNISKSSLAGSQQPLRKKNTTISDIIVNKWSLDSGCLVINQLPCTSYTVSFTKSVILRKRCHHFINKFVGLMSLLMGRHISDSTSGSQQQHQKAKVLRFTLKKKLSCPQIKCQKINWICNSLPFSDLHWIRYYICRETILPRTFLFR